MQAALLRAAEPAELDYSVCRESSAVIHSLLLEMLSHCERTKGEALIEFLMALCLGRLRLTRSDQIAVAQAVCATRPAVSVEVSLASRLLR